MQMKLLIGTKIVTGVVSKKSMAGDEKTRRRQRPRRFENDTLGIENKNYEPSHHTVLEIFEEPPRVVSSSLSSVKVPDFFSV